MWNTLLIFRKYRKENQNICDVNKVNKINNFISEKQTMMNNSFLKASLMTGTDVDTLLRQYFIPDKFTGEDEIEYLNFRKNWDLMVEEMTELHYSG